MAGRGMGGWDAGEFGGMKGRRAVEWGEEC